MHSFLNYCNLLQIHKLKKIVLDLFVMYYYYQWLKTHFPDLNILQYFQQQYFPLLDFGKPNNYLLQYYYQLDCYIQHYYQYQHNYEFRMNLHQHIRLYKHLYHLHQTCTNPYKNGIKTLLDINTCIFSCIFSYCNTIIGTISFPNLL